jgi:dTDP-glucose 4,6-dehydratase
VRTHPSFRFVHADIGDREVVERVIVENDIDVVVHFAAESHVDRSIEDASAFVRTNVVGTHVLLECVRRAWMKDGAWRPGVRFHHVSTDEVYGPLADDAEPFAETARYQPSSPYAATKAGADHLVRAYRSTYGLPVTLSNCSNNYGPFQFPEKLIPLLIVSALLGQALPVYGDGSNVRDWLHVEDHCHALEAILQRGEVGATYNVGGKNQWRNIDTARLVCSILSSKLAGDAELRRRFPACPAATGHSIERLIRFVADRPGHDKRYALDTSKLERHTGWAPLRRFEDGLASTVEWYLENEQWWRDILSGAYQSVPA